MEDEDGRGKKRVEGRHQEALYSFCSSTVPSTVFETSLKLCHSRRPLDGGQGSGESGRAESNSQGDIASPDDFHWFSFLRIETLSGEGKQMRTTIPGPPPAVLRGESPGGVNQGPDENTTRAFRPERVPVHQGLGPPSRYPQQGRWCGIPTVVDGA